ncbi:acetyltransferase [Desmospora profundinema]|uniref:UDP-perosamine 4-acetyltransferase n=1 Tax=Desmospora profundinema TaxID=1571184 RepID=A0ABU1IUB0_9BACL|nr:acetyltransferase [Desmospora profundinema]MDR6227504.1 UDP-perosamine 4-acetyltransferase [Desmospora profundinema]
MKANQQAIAIIGAGGHARVVADILTRVQPTRRQVFFANTAHDSWNPSPLFPDDPTVMESVPFNIKGWHVAIGDPTIRKEKIQFLLHKGWTVYHAIHDRSTLASTSVIGDGTAVMAGAVLNPGAQTGTGCIVNTQAVLEHDSRIGHYVNVGPGAVLAGSAEVGSGSEVGAGAIILPGIRVGTHCVVGAGAVVTRDLKDGSVAVGVPARPIRTI